MKRNEKRNCKTQRRKKNQPCKRECACSKRDTRVHNKGKKKGGWTGNERTFCQCWSSGVKKSRAAENRQPSHPPAHSSYSSARSKSVRTTMMAKRALRLSIWLEPHLFAR